jgi:hypothetical protein
MKEQRPTNKVPGKMTVIGGTQELRDLADRLNTLNPHTVEDVRKIKRDLKK